MRGIKTGNFLMYRNSQICLICNITSNGSNAPVSIMGIDCNNQMHEGPVSDWSTIIGKSEQLQKFSDSVFNNILQGKQTKCVK